MARTAPTKDLKEVLGIEDCEDPECRAPLNILHSLLNVAAQGKVTDECKDRILKAAKLEEWRHDKCLLDKDTLGRGTWGLLHNAAIKYPDKPTSLQQNTMRGLMEGVAMFFPCKTCSHDITEQLKESPLRSTESRTALRLWLCDQHNRVNEKLGKSTFRCEMACLEKRWKKSNEQGCLNDDAEPPEYRVGGGDGH